MSALAGTFGGLLDQFARAFGGVPLTSPADPLAGMPPDLSPEEVEAYLDLVVSRAEQVGLVRDAARAARIKPSEVLGRTGTPAGPGNNRDRRRVLARLVLAVRTRFARLARPLVEGAQSLMGWFGGFRRQITTAHGAAAMLAHGTTAPEPGVIASTARFVARQWGYARNFATQIATGAHVLGKATLSRAAMYADAAWTHFMGLQLQTAIMAGKTEARRILGFADHCTTSKAGTPGCVELARKGWVDINTVVPIGKATCRSRCHCSITFR